MQRRLIVPLAVLTLSSAFCGTAQAALPTFKTKTIDAKALGGVRLGMTFTQAETAWGRGSVCTNPQTCSPLEKNAPCVRETVPHFATCTWRSSSTGPSASVTMYNHKVVAISISGSRTSRPARLRTRDGFGLGTPGSTLFKASCSSSAGSRSTTYSCRKVNFTVTHKTRRATVVGIGRPVV